MSNISNAKKYAALWLNSQGKEASDIAKELTLSNAQVLDIIASSGPTETTAITNKSLMITHTAGKKANNVAIVIKEFLDQNQNEQ